MENNIEASGEFGNLVMAVLLPSFERVRSQLHEQAPANSLAQGLLEIADTITFDEEERRFYQVHTNVPTRPGGPISTVRFPMLAQEVGLLTDQMRSILSSPET